MKNDEKIRKYIEDELSGDELNNFEKEIYNSAELKNEITKLRKTINDFQKLNHINAGEYYFNNLLPRLKDKVEKSKKYNLKPSFAFGSIFIIMLSVLVVFILKSNDEIIQDEQTAFQKVDVEELNFYLKNSDRDLTTFQFFENVPDEYDSVFSLMIADELIHNGYSGEYFVDVSGNDFYKIYNELTEEEMEGIYNSLISMNFR